MMATVMNVVSIIALILVLNSYQIKSVLGLAINNETLVIISETDEEAPHPSSTTTTDSTNQTVSTNHTLAAVPMNATLAKDGTENGNTMESSTTTMKPTTEAPVTTSNPQQMLIPPASVNASIAQLPSANTHKHKQGQIIIR